MVSHPGNSNWLEIDLHAIGKNIEILKKTTAVDVMAVVKANGYGHGIVDVSTHAEKSGASFCGVARIGEALELRRAGIKLPTLVLGYTPNDHLEEAISNDISISVFHPGQVSILSSASRLAGKPAKVHVKVDTGMSRLGAEPSLAYKLVQDISSMSGVYLEGIFTHFACADIPELPINDQQEKLFEDLLAELQGSNLRPPMVHAANSAAALTRPSTRFDMVRIGIAIYGMSPSNHIQLPEGIQPTLEWKARISNIFSLPPGRGVSYGHDYVTTKHERIGVVPVGYGDGYRWSQGNTVLVQGRKTPVIGRVCMDQIIVQLDQVPNTQVGDEVVLLGQQGDESISAQTLANLWETINYEVTCGVSARVPRHFRDS
jgi:alanine racemase